MTASHRDEPLSPFPYLPDTITNRYSVGKLWLRPFGLYEQDLEIDFLQEARPCIVTRILECCTRSTARDENLDSSFFWNLTVGKRIEGLLIIAALDGQRDASFQLRCLNKACHEELELELTLEEMAELQRRANDTEQFTVSYGEESFLMRRPTGNDQLLWLKSSYAGEAVAVREMIRALVLDDEEAASIRNDWIDDECVRIINEAIAEVDPLVNFSLQVRCPFCEEQKEYELDLEELSLRRLWRAQRRLLKSVHRLAKNYHWSEQQIFSVPHWRRSYYLSLIGQEEER
jgi:sarcosine oxidase delta subunit